MDFLDPKKERRNRIVLLTSYCLVAIAIGLTSWMLLYQTDGYCLSRDGKVDRCGLVFVSSQPTGADMYIDGKLQKVQTNTKVNLRSGIYDFRVSRQGYNDWRRTINVSGGDVQRFDYPFLFPTNLKTTTLTTFSGTLGFVTQSPNRRWLVVADSLQSTQLTVYDLRNAEKPDVRKITVPTSVLTPAESTQSWEVVEWADDNRHLLVKRTYTASGAQAQEYLLIDRQDGLQLRNVTKELGIAPVESLRLFNKKQNLFYVYNSEAKTLRTLGFGGSSPTSLQLQRVLGFKAYSDDTILYITDTPLGTKATPDKVSAVLQQGTRISVLRQLPVAQAYLLDIAEYDGSWYVGVGSVGSKGVYLFQNPLDAVLAKPTDLPSPVRFLKLANPTHISFSANTQFVLVSNSQEHTVYDLEYKNIYHYSSQPKLDVPQAHPSWMDGNRLVYVSEGRGYVYDYDNLNSRLLQAASPMYALIFAPDFQTVFSIASNAAGQPILTRTSLVAE